MALPSDPNGFLVGEQLRLANEANARLVETLQRLEVELQRSRQVDPADIERRKQERIQRIAEIRRVRAEEDLARTEAERIATEARDREDAERDRKRQQEEEERDRRESAAEQRKALIGGIQNTVSSGLSVVNTDNLDPTITVAREVKELAAPVIAPIKAIGGFAFKKLFQRDDENNTIPWYKKILNAITANAPQPQQQSGGLLSTILKGALLGGAVIGVGSAVKSAIGSGSVSEGLKKGWPSLRTGDVAGNLGALSAEFESGGDISAVNPDPANKSMNYGKYQFNVATGGLKAFFDANPQYAKEFSGLSAGSSAFGEKWKELAKADPAAFEAAQTNAIKKMFYEPALAEAQKSGFDTSNPAIQAAVFSTSVGSGLKGNKKIYQSAAKAGLGGTTESQLEAMYTARDAYVQSLSSVPADVKSSMHTRYQKELKKAIEMERARQPVDVKAPVMPSAPSASKASERAPAPITEPVKVPLSTKDSVKITATTQAASIGQNMSDRAIAQLVTGGMGQYMGSRSV